MVTVITTSIAALVSTVATRLVLLYAKKRLVDQVNQRSSHRIAKPRGGGLGLVIGMLGAWLPMASLHGADLGILWLAGAIMGMAALGWWDDHCDLPARVRLPMQLSLVGVVILVIGTPTQVILAGTFSVPVLVWWFWPVAILGGGWMVNLTNFMDGIDGIAASQGLIGCVGLALLLPPEAEFLRLLLLACAAACLGFLVWNRPPAKIFMGDVGSTALGLVFTIGVIGGLRHGLTLEVLLLPLMPFISDATCTLSRRAWLRERLYEGHRTHLYQRLARAWRSHLPATLLFTGLAVVGVGLAFAIHHTWLPPGTGLGIWAVIFTALILYGRRRCPVGQEQTI